jgi:hypothetical protein
LYRLGIENATYTSMSQLTGNDKQLSELDKLTKMRDDFKKKRDSSKNHIAYHNYFHIKYKETQEQLKELCKMMKRL